MQFKIPKPQQIVLLSIVPDRKFEVGLSPNEVVEQLECSLYEYQKHMSLAKMKTNWGTCRTIVCVAAEFAEDIVKFKWSKAAQLLFTLKNREIALAEAELRAPGKEVAYIVAAKEKFSGPA